MSYEEALRKGNVKIGTKQTMKVLESGEALEVFVAKDAEPRVTSKVIQLCRQFGVKVTYVETMKMLGKACGIEVGAATAVLCKDS